MRKREDNFSKTARLEPVNQIVVAALRAVYSGGAKNAWKINNDSCPYYDYQKEGSRIAVSYYLPWEHPIKGLPTFTRRFMRTRWSLLHAHRLRSAVRDMKVETADIFLLLLACLSKSSDPFRIGARISLAELAEQRGVKVRHGSSPNLKRDLQNQLNHLVNLRLTISLSAATEKELHIVSNCREEPLFKLAGAHNTGKRPMQASYTVTCSEPLACFLKQSDLNAVHLYCKDLIKLNPYRFAFTKKMGIFWLIYGGIKKQATPREILSFSGEKANIRNPGQTVDMFIDACNRLQDMGILEDTPLIEPFDRSKGYFDSWLDLLYSVQLSGDIQQVLQAESGFEKPVNGNTAGEPDPLGQGGLSITLKQIKKNPQIIRKMRGVLNEGQSEVARNLGVSRQTLSKYERGISCLPRDKAIRLLAFWKSRLNDSQL